VQKNQWNEKNNRQTCFQPFNEVFGISRTVFKETDRFFCGRKIKICEMPGDTGTVLY
jgi:hypothetical protein